MRQATVEFVPGFDVEVVWNRLLQTTERRSITLLMAVPTIYQRLLAFYDTCSAEQQTAKRRAVKNLRLCVSGSAALPVPVFEKWEQVAGTPLLERYGMTEIGKARTSREVL